MTTNKPQTFTVAVKKDYYQRYYDEDQTDSEEDPITVCGTIEIEAASQAEAENVVKGWMVCQAGVKTFQTVDPRITWERDCLDLHEDGYEYLDFSFEVVTLLR